MDITICTNERTNPRDWDNVGTMVCFHRRYSLGDKHDYRSQDFSSWAGLQDKLVKDGAVVILPLYMYYHSGQDIATQYQPYWWHADWDAGQIGFIAAFRPGIENCIGWKRISKRRLPHLRTILKEEVEEYAKYIRGEPEYRWSATLEDGSLEDGDIFGDRQDCIAAAKARFGDDVNVLDATPEYA
jgi:hypothetical protein